MKKMFYIDRLRGASIEFRNGFSLGFNWMHSNGRTSKSSAVLAAYHHPKSITWRWALYWTRPQKLSFSTSFKRKNTGYGWAVLSLPLIGGFTLNWQPHMWRGNHGK